MVVVEESPVKAAMEDRLIVEGVTLTFSPIVCRIECNNRSLCIPEGLRENDKCQVIKVGEN